MKARLLIDRMQWIVYSRLVGSDLMRYRVLLIDADDTLLDFQKCEQVAINDTFKKYGLAFNEAIFEVYKKHNHALWAAFERGEIDKQKILAKRFRNTFEELGYSDVPSSFEEDYQKALGEGGYLLPNVEDVLEQLSSKCSLYIATNGVKATQRSRLAKSGILKYIKDVFISEEIGAQKPQKEYFDAVFEKLGNGNKEEILMVGDSLGSDIQGGVNAGIDTCWLNVHKKESTLPTYEIHEISELVNLVLAEESTQEEEWDLYDENRVLQPISMKRGESVPEGLYHLVTEVWVISGDKILLTRRHPNKHYGGCYECTGGSVIKGENSLQGAVRELQEEIGLPVNQEELTLVAKTKRGNYFIDTYILKKDINIEDLELLDCEVIGAIQVDYPTLLEMMEEQKVALPIAERSKKYQEKWEQVSLLTKK